MFVGLLKSTLGFDPHSSHLGFLSVCFQSLTDELKDIDTFIEEQSALVDKKTLYDIYKIATEEAYSFLFVKLRMSDVNKIFMKRLEAEIHIN